MSGTQSKKRKASDLEADEEIFPIIMKCPGFRPDMQIMVFNQEFHVHSMLVKIHSTFFRKFLDAPGNSAQNNSPGNDNGAIMSLAPLESRIWSGSNSMRYIWVTKVDDGGKTWSLVSDTLKNHPYQLESYEENTDDAIEDFKILLMAIYNLPYSIKDTEQLIRLTALADYYCALSILSRTLDSAMLRSTEFCHSICRVADELIPVAAKIRNALLFRECLIWLAGPHSDPDFNRIANRTLRNIAKMRHGTNDVQISRYTTAILKVIATRWVTHPDNATSSLKDT